MACITEWDNEQQRVWDEWVASRPPGVRTLCEKFPPNKLYRLKSSGHRVTVYSYAEDGTLTVEITGQYNLIAFDRQVFGIKPEGLEECDLPAPDEPIGFILSDEEALDADIENYIEDRRRYILRRRP